MGCFVRGGRNGMLFFVRSGKNGMGYLISGEKQHGMFCPGWQIFVGCSVRGVKNGMGCFFWLPNTAMS